jgi:hypothetical protein
MTMRFANFDGVTAAGSTHLAGERAIVMGALWGIGIETARSYRR